MDHRDVPGGQALDHCSVTSSSGSRTFDGTVRPNSPLHIRRSSGPGRTRQARGGRTTRAARTPPDSRSLGPRRAARAARADRRKHLVTGRNVPRRSGGRRSGDAEHPGWPPRRARRSVPVLARGSHIEMRVEAVVTASAFAAPGEHLVVRRDDRVVSVSVAVVGDRRWMSRLVPPSSSPGRHPTKPLIPPSSTCNRSCG